LSALNILDAVSDNVSLDGLVSFFFPFGFKKHILVSCDGMSKPLFFLEKVSANEYLRIRIPAARECGRHF
jgi:hypothetical protein